MDTGHLPGWLAWLTVVGAYAGTALRLGRVKVSPADGAGPDPFPLTLVSARSRVAPPRGPQRSPMTISTLLTPEMVLLDFAPDGKREAIDLLAAHLAGAHPAIDRRHLAAALQERERQSTTAIENGVAIPHVRLPGIATPLAAFARSTPGIACDSADGQPTRFFLLLVVPAEQPGSHLRLLASAARLLGDARCRARLLAAASADEMLAVLREHETRAQRGLHAA